MSELKLVDVWEAYERDGIKTVTALSEEAARKGGIERFGEIDLVVPIKMYLSDSDIEQLKANEFKS